MYFHFSSKGFYALTTSEQFLCSLGGSRLIVIVIISSAFA